MKNNYTFFWLDDQAAKVEAMRSVLEAGIPERGISATVRFIEITPTAIKNLEELADQIGSSGADMIIVDHVFNQAGPLNTKGSSIAHLLRSAFPKLPIVCVSAAWGTHAAFDQEDLSEYTYIFPYSRLADELELLYAIAKDFERCADAIDNGTTTSFVRSLLGAPEMEVTSLERILPAEFMAVEQKTTPHRVARWILGTFTARPGYLYNEIRAATLLGLNVDGFGKVKDRFSDSLYTGAFATDSAPRWWVASLHDQLALLAPADAPSVTQLAGRQLDGITEQDYSKCYFEETTNPPPDTVAYLDDNNNTEVAVRGGHTKLYPADVGGLPGFEPRMVLMKRLV